MINDKELNCNNIYIYIDFETNIENIIIRWVRDTDEKYHVFLYWTGTGIEIVEVI